MTAPSVSSGTLIAVDWGTTRLRAMLVDSRGAVIAERASDDGIGALAAGAHEVAFERAVAGWPEVPAIMAGMIGSRQGWHEAAYVPCPAAVPAIASGLLRFVTSRGRPVAIVPGVMLRSKDRDGDVIRGEETQIVGLVDGEPAYAGLAILPGTHSKWATIRGGAITGFQTYLTGELFTLLSRHSFLRHSVSEDGRDLAGEPDFALGVRRTASEGLPFLASVFSVRVRQLLDDVAREANLAYLSGLVIGGEIAAAEAAGLLRRDEPIRVIGSRSLARAYRRAFGLIGIDAPSRDGGDLVLSGLIHLARASGFSPGATP